MISTPSRWSSSCWTTRAREAFELPAHVLAGSDRCPRASPSSTARPGRGRPRARGSPPRRSPSRRTGRRAAGSRPRADRLAPRVEHEQPLEDADLGGGEPDALGVAPSGSIIRSTSCSRYSSNSVTSFAFIRSATSGYWRIWASALAAEVLALERFVACRVVLVVVLVVVVVLVLVLVLVVVVVVVLVLVLVCRCGRRHGTTVYAGKRVEDPGGVERRAAVGAAADLDEVARAGIHRQAGLDRVPAVVLLDQLVDLAEVPALGDPAPARRGRRDARRRPPRAARAGGSISSSIVRSRRMYGSGPPSEAM